MKGGRATWGYSGNWALSGPTSKRNLAQRVTADWRLRPDPNDTLERLKQAVANQGKPTTRDTLPMQLQPGDRFTDEKGEWRSSPIHARREARSHECPESG